MLPAGHLLPEPCPEPEQQGHPERVLEACCQVGGVQPGQLPCVSTVHTVKVFAHLPRWARTSMTRGTPHIFHSLINGVVCWLKTVFLLQLWNLKQQQDITFLFVLQSKLPSNNLLELWSILFRNCGYFVYLYKIRLCVHWNSSELASRSYFVIHLTHTHNQHVCDLDEFLYPVLCCDVFDFCLSSRFT